MRWKRVGVLLGGISEEREVSLNGGAAVADALRRCGYDTVIIDVDRDMSRRVQEAEVEAVFIALHGKWGEDGTVQGLLELLAIPYTGSSVMSSAIAMDKIMTRHLLRSHGIPVPRGFQLPLGESHSLPSDFVPPVIVKPADEGSSFGVSLVREMDDYHQAAQKALQFSDRVVVEQYVEGTEATVAVLNGEVLGSLEVEPVGDFYDYGAKYAQGGSTHHIPPRIGGRRIDEIHHLGRRAYEALCCAGAARVDFIVPEDGETVVLEVNTIPGMTEMSLLPDIARSSGMSFDNLVVQIMESAALHVVPSKSN
jgi:D-alanine-D-alanine ligase